MPGAALLMVTSVTMSFQVAGAGVALLVESFRERFRQPREMIPPGSRLLKMLIIAFLLSFPPGLTFVRQTAYARIMDVALWSVVSLGGVAAAWACLHLGPTGAYAGEADTISAMHAAWQVLAFSSGTSLIGAVAGFLLPRWSLTCAAILGMPPETFSSGGQPGVQQ
jgi:hypothetical protein